MATPDGTRTGGSAELGDEATGLSCEHCGGSLALVAALTGKCAHCRMAPTPVQLERLRKRLGPVGDDDWPFDHCAYCGRWAVTLRSMGKCYACGHVPGEPVCQCGDMGPVQRLHGEWQCQRGHSVPRPPPDRGERPLGDLEGGPQRATFGRAEDQPAAPRTVAYVALVLAVVALGMGLSGFCLGLQAFLALQELAGR